MQYLSWPDHGTPSDTVEFVEFVESVRDFREKSATVAPTIVHCRSETVKINLWALYDYFWGPICEAKFLEYLAFTKSYTSAKVYT